MSEWLAFAREFGWPLAALLFVLVTGAMGKWYFGSVVDKLSKQYEERLAELRATIATKNEQIERLLAVNEKDADTSRESLRLAQEEKAALERIETELRARGGRRRDDQ